MSSWSLLSIYMHYCLCGGLKLCCRNGFVFILPKVAYFYPRAGIGTHAIEA